MITLLIQQFVKDKENIEDPVVRKAYALVCGGLGIFFNLCLFAGKCFAAIFSNSIAILGDALNNLSDAGSSLITLIGFHLAGQKPDSSHPYGHGRIEYLTGLFVSVAIILMGFELIKSSVEKLIHPETVIYTTAALIILAVSILIKLYMAYYYTSVGKKLNSAAMKATATDSFGDAGSTLVVLASALLGRYASLNIDAYCGILVGLFILYAGIGSAKDTISPLLGQPPKKEFIDKIKNLVSAHEGVLGIHDLIVHDYGPGRIMVSLHVEVDSTGNMIDIHEMIDAIEKELSNKCHCAAVIHMDPILVNDPLTDEVKAKAKDLLHKLDTGLELHDFRLVKGADCLNIFFDVLLPFEFKMTDQEVVEHLTNGLHDINPQYHAVIEVDKAYY